MENKKLYYTGGMSKEDFFKKIEGNGGWPLDKRYVSVFHTVDIKRECSFDNKSLRNEWWTTLYDVDDYLWWKMSPDGKKKFVKQENESLRDKLRAFVRSNF